VKLYVGIDISKTSCVAAFLSHENTTKRPALLHFAQSRSGFEALSARMRSLAPLAECTVLVEHTGHYAHPLLQFLHEQGVACSMLHVQERDRRKQKSDRRDAQALCRLLYNQQALGVEAEAGSRLYPLLAPAPHALRLSALTHHYEDVTVGIVARLNRLTAICDEVFPEFTRIFKDPNLLIALAYREHFPTPALLACATIDDLRALRRRSFPSEKQLVELQRLARESIGVKNADRLDGLLLEQQHLIAELRLLQSERADLEVKITAIVEGCREGQILTSIPGIGMIQAGILIAAIGTIANFRRAADLKSYCGWAPREVQTGTTSDSRYLPRGGNGSLRRLFYLATMTAIGHDTEFRALYQRLLPLKCSYDARTKRYRGAKKLIGRIAGQLITLVYALLQHDHEVLAALKEGEEAPTPVLYDREIHRRHRSGHYIPLKHAR